MHYLPLPVPLFALPVRHFSSSSCSWDRYSALRVPADRGQLARCDGLRAVMALLLGSAKKRAEATGSHRDPAPYGITSSAVARSVPGW